MSETIEVTCKLPHKYEHPNYRVNHAGMARVRKASRHNAYLCALINTARILPWPGAFYSAVVYHKTNRSHDEDGFIASLKATLDGIADAGLVANDSTFRFVGPIVWKIDKLNPRVELRFERLGETK